MSGIDAEPTPGTAFRTITEEYEYLKEFMSFVEKRILMDIQYVEDLTALRDSVNPMWPNSGIWNLISPMITHLDEEILHRSEANEALRARYSILPSHLYPKNEDETGAKPLAKYENLKRYYLEYDGCHKVVSTTEGILELQGWYQGLRREARKGYKSTLLSLFVLPLADRDYRQAVCDQREAAKEALAWHVNQLPNALESHQQHVEDVKSFIGDTLTDWSRAAAALSISCSKAIKDNHEFSSSQHIAGRHDEYEQEKTHVLLQEVRYRQFMLNGQEAEPLLGVRSTLKSMEMIRKPLIRERYGFIPAIGVGSLDLALGMERNCVVQDVQTVLENASIHEIRSYLPSCLATRPPLIPIGPDFAKLYKDGVPRDKLSIIMQNNEISPVLMHTLIFLGGKTLYRTMDHLLTHSDEPLPHLSIMRDIWRKWDFDHCCPLPKGVERVGEGRTPAVWTKTGMLFVGPKIPQSRQFLHDLPVYAIPTS